MEVLTFAELTLTSFAFGWRWRSISFSWHEEAPSFPLIVDGLFDSFERTEVVFNIVLVELCLKISSKDVHLIFFFGVFADIVLFVVVVRCKFIVGISANFQEDFEVF